MHPFFRSILTLDPDTRIERVREAFPQLDSGGGVLPGEGVGHGMRGGSVGGGSVGEVGGGLGGSSSAVGLEVLLGDTQKLLASLQVR